MTHTVYAAAMIAALVARPAQAAGLAELFSSPAAANLTIDTIHDYFAPRSTSKISPATAASQS